MTSMVMPIHSSHVEYGNVFSFQEWNKEFIFRFADSNFQKMKIWVHEKKLTVRIVEDSKFHTQNSYLQH